MQETATETKWTQYGEKHLVGRKIVAVRYLTRDEAEALGWNERSVVLVLDNGAALYPSADDEGNGPGALFGNDGDKEITCPVIP
jgi:hypothetical protein